MDALQMYILRKSIECSRLSASTNNVGQQGSLITAVILGYKTKSLLELPLQLDSN